MFENNSRKIAANGEIIRFSQSSVALGLVESDCEANSAARTEVSQRAIGQFRVA